MPWVDRGFGAVRQSGCLLRFIAYSSGLKVDWWSAQRTLRGSDYDDCFGGSFDDIRFSFVLI